MSEACAKDGNEMSEKGGTGHFENFRALQTEEVVEGDIVSACSENSRSETVHNWFGEKLTETTRSIEGSRLLSRARV